MTDEDWMKQAIMLAKKAEEEGEVPVGAIVVKDGVAIATGWNQMISLNDPSAHAEMQAIRNAAAVIGNYRLLDCTLYVTLEPCSMCAGTMVHGRIKRLVYGASDLKTGAAGSVLNLVQYAQFNHQLDITSGVLAQECAEQLSGFFKMRRAQHEALKRHEQLD